MTFISPTPESGTVPRRNMAFNIRINDQGGGVGRVEWRINGMTIGVGGADDRGLKIVAWKQQGVEIEKLITLSPGQNTVEVVAYNSRNEIASDPVSITLELKDAISEKPSLYILAVGINDYRDGSLALKYSVPDVHAMTNAFKKGGKDIYQKIRVTELLDDNVVIGGIEIAFKNLEAEVKTNDVFIFYLAGHGVTIDGRYYFLPYDFRFNNMESVKKSGITQEHIQKWLSGITSLKSLVLLDTCNSAAFKQTATAQRGIAEKVAIDKLTRAMGRLTFAASAEDLPALEGCEGHGCFTFSLLQSLREADGKNGNNNGLVETNELIGYVSDLLPDITRKKFGHEQNPQISDQQGMPFPLVRAQ